ncbi:hypothetical protein FRX31_008603, partial [Thalictrum thalictroides]
MARILLPVLGTEGIGESLYPIPGTLLLLCMIVASLSMISMVVLACGQHSDHKRKKKRAETPVASSGNDVGHGAAGNHGVGNDGAAGGAVAFVATTGFVSGGGGGGYNGADGYGGGHGSHGGGGGHGGYGGGGGHGGHGGGHGG